MLNLNWLMLIHGMTVAGSGVGCWSHGDRSMAAAAAACIPPGMMAATPSGDIAAAGETIAGGGEECRGGDVDRSSSCPSNASTENDSRCRRDLFPAGEGVLLASPPDDTAVVVSLSDIIIIKNLAGFFFSWSFWTSVTLGWLKCNWMLHWVNCLLSLTFRFVTRPRTTCVYDLIYHWWILFAGSALRIVGRFLVQLI